jgi:hypothetical protein
VTTVEIVTSPTKGTLIVSETTGEIIYTPNGQDLGADSFTYTVKDTSGVTSNVATVNLTVNPSNTAPVANDDNVTTIEKTAVVFKVLDNDTDAENNIDVRTLEIATQPQNGTVNLNATTGEITYTPQDDFLGNDSFTYTVKDTNGLTSNVGTVNILVRPANTDPVANDDNVTTLKDESVIINVLNNDTDAENNIDITTLKIESQPENGTLSVDEQTGEITYTPVTGFIGNDSFTYTVQDTTGRVSNIATVNVRVNEFNNNPANFNNDQIFELGGNENQTKQLKLSFVSQNTKFVNEIGVFRIDNEQGGINGITPDNPNYLQTALENSQVVFSSLPNNVLQGVEFTRLLNFEGSDRLVFYLVQNSTTETVLSDLAAGRTPANVLLALPTANSNGFDPLDISDLNNESFTLAWRDNFNSNDNTFDDLVMKVEIVDATSSPIGTGLQGQIELIDLRNLGTLEAKFKVASEAAYNNTIGWYVVDDETGRIGDLKPGDAGYAQAAIAQRSITHFTREGIESAQLQGLLAPYLIADASRESFLANNPNNINGNGPVAYFAFMGANPDGVDHVRQLGDNTFGFEDLFGGGDRDYNDIIIQVEFA